MVQNVVSMSIYRCTQHILNWSTLAKTSVHIPCVCSKETIGFGLWSAARCALPTRRLEITWPPLFYVRLSLSAPSTYGMRGIRVSEKSRGIKSDGIIYPGLLNTAVYRPAVLIMVALCNRADHYIFAPLFLSIYLSSSSFFIPLVYIFRVIPLPWGVQANE